MKELLSTLEAWQADGADVGRAVVVRTFGSAPRPEGAVLLYAADGRIAGLGQRRLRRGRRGRGDRAGPRDRPRPGHPLRHQRRAGLGRRAGLRRARSTCSSSRPCPRRRSQAAIASQGAGGHGAAVITPLPADSPPAEFGQHTPGEGAPPEPELVVHDDGRLEGTLGDPARRRGARRRRPARRCERGLSRTAEIGDRSLFIEVFPVRPRLVVVGAVEVARSLVRLARELGFETVVVDGRPSFATPERFPDVDLLVVGWPDEVADEIGLGPNDAVAVLTHDVKFDEPAIVEALRRGCRYVGAVGSKKTQADRRAAAARCRRDPGRAGPAARPGRAGPRRSPAGRDRPGDPRRGRRRAVRGQRRARSRSARGPSRDDRHRPRGRRRLAVRWRQAAGLARGAAGPAARPRPGRRGGHRRRRRRARRRRRRPSSARSTGAAERRVRNPDPARGLSSSVQRRRSRHWTRRRRRRAHRPRRPAARSIPRSSGALLDAAPTTSDPSSCRATRRTAVATRCSSGRAAFALVDELSGDRGLGPVIAAHPDLVREVARRRARNPDVDTRADLVALLETAWAARVRANNDQVDRHREVPDGTDFYAPVTGLFRADPTRTDEPVLVELLRDVERRRDVAGHRRRRRVATRCRWPAPSHRAVAR